MIPKMVYTSLLLPPYPTFLSRFQRNLLALLLAGLFYTKFGSRCSYVEFLRSWQLYGYICTYDPDSLTWYRKQRCKGRNWHCLVFEVKRYCSGFWLVFGADIGTSGVLRRVFGYGEMLWLII